MQPNVTSIAEAIKAGTFGLKLPALPGAPFVGLRPFNSNEALLFFGRREQTVELLQQLHRTRFVAVVGSSGCGKSSLVRAGLIPKLKAGFLVEDRDEWIIPRISLMKPGDAPLRNLAATLLEATGDDGDKESFAEAIRVEGVHAVIEHLSPHLSDSNANLLLLVDQFEEIFRFGFDSGSAEHRTEAEKFVEVMLALSRQRELPAYVVMTMRSDFIGDCDQFYGLPEAPNRSQFLVPRLTREQLRQAVEGPVNLFGGSISSHLLERVLNDVGEKSDQLPVTQFALMRTWERWRESGDSQIDFQHYESAGGIKNALSQDAEAALKGMSEVELKITERMFQALTDTDARNRRIRRPALLSEIASITDTSREQILQVIHKFQSEGRFFITLTSGDDPLVDIQHESIIRQWQKVDEWVDAEVEARKTYMRIYDAAQLYKKRGDEDLLWQGSQLEIALEWQRVSNPNAAWAWRYHTDLELAEEFLKKSLYTRELGNTLGGIVTLFGLDVYGVTLLTRRVADSMKAVAVFLLINFFFNLGAWWLLFNRLVAAG